MRLTNLRKYIFSVVTSTLCLLLYPVSQHVMPATDSSKARSRARSQQPRSFLGDLAFVAMTTPEERRKLREKRRGGTSERSSRSGSKHRSHTKTGSEGKESEPSVAEHEFWAQQEETGYREVARWRYSGQWHEVRYVVDGSSAEDSVDTPSRSEQEMARAFWQGEPAFGKGVKRGTKTGESEDVWDTADERLASETSYTEERKSTKNTPSSDDSWEAMQRLSLGEPQRSGPDNLGQGSWRQSEHTAAHSRRGSQSAPPRMTEAASISRRASPPGVWPASSAGPQSASSLRRRTPSARERESSPRARSAVSGIFRSDEPGRGALNLEKIRAREEGRKGRHGAGRPAPAATSILHYNPNNIRPRRPKRASSGSRHLRPGLPLTTANLMRYTVARGGEKGFKAKGADWKGCTAGGRPDAQSEGSLWDGGSLEELEPLDSISVRAFKGTRYFGQQ